MQSFKIFGNILLLLALISGLAACGGSGGGSATGSTTITGSAGDGPVTGGAVNVTDANGNAVTTTPANPTTGSNAQFNFTVPTGTALPLTITVTGGTDTVTGVTQDFPLRTAVTTLPANGSVTGNANPLSTLAVASAEAQPGGITTASLSAAINNILGAVGFGLGTGINPISTTVDNTNAANIVRASEAAAELIRRASNASGSTLSNTIASIAQDLTDGVIDGNVAAGATATQVSNTNASHILSQQAQVSAETLANNLTITAPTGATIVSGANFTATLNSSITTTGRTGDVGNEAPTQEFLDQTRTAISIANTLTGGGNAALNNLLGGINTFTAGATPSAAQQNNLSALTTAATFPSAGNITTNANTAATAATAAAADTTAPVAPTITSPTANATTATTALTITGSAETGALVTVLSGTASLGTANANGTATGAVSLWTLTVNLSDAAHPITATATDTAGNTSTASAVAATITVDTIAPTVAITTSAANPTNAAFTATLTFSEAVTGVALADFSVVNGAAGTFAAVSTTVYTALITPAGQGAVTVDVAANAATDAAGNNNTAATQLSVTYDNVVPTVAISTTAASPTNAAFTATLTFSEAVTGVTLADFAVSNGTTGTFNAVSSTVYTALITPTVPGAVTVNVAANAATDTAGNGNTIATQLSVTFDNVAPTATLSTTSANPTNVSPIPAKVTFNEAVTGVTIVDFVIGNGTAGNLVAVSTTIYTVDITPTVPGAVTVNVAANVATDAAGNGNTVTTQLSVTYDNVAPTLTSVSIASNNATTTVAKAGDVVTVTFTSSETLGALPTATIATKASAVSNTGGNTYTATYTMLAGDTQGATAFTIDFADTAGNAGTQVTAVTNASGVAFDSAAPTLTSVSIASNNATTTVAKVGDVVTVTFTSSETLGALPTATIATKAAAVSNTSGNTYTATYTMLTGDTQGATAFTIGFADTAGNAGTQVTAVTNASGVAFDSAAPSPPTISSPASGSYTSTTTPTARGLAGSTEANATVEIFDTDGTTSLGTTTAAGDGSWTLTSSALATGSHSLTAKATDTAGNTSNASVTATVTINNISKFAYVANLNSNTVSMFNINSTTGQLSHNGFISTTISPLLSTSPSGKFIYLTSTLGNVNANGNVTVYSINQTTGKLTSQGTVATGKNPQPVTLDPPERFAYVANDVSKTVSAYTVNQSTGALTLIAGTPVSTGNAPRAVTVDPTGRFAYVPNVTSSTVSTYSINQTSGALAAVGTTAAGTQATSVAVDPSGRFAYVANWGAATISMFSINQTTGALGAIAGGTIASGVNPQHISIDPSGRFAYVANGAVGENSVSAYTINTSTGALAAITGSPFSVGVRPLSVSIDAAGKFITVSNFGDNTVSTHSINQTTGALSAATSSIGTQTSPRFITIAPGTSSATDTLAPGQPAISSPAANATANTNTPTVSGTSEAGATIKLYSGTTTLTLVGTTTADAFGNWTLTSGALNNGTHTLTVTATDAAGNVSVVSAGVSITVATANPIITGAAVDGYVSGATLTVYSDLALTTQIGSGTTDTGGQFSIQLTTTSVPDPMYLKSVGGTDIDTGMPAPTMMFTVSGSPTTGLNITPMTNAVYGRVLDGQLLNAAQLGLLTDLGLTSNAELYGDPAAAGNLQAGMFRALTSGTMGATLSAGNYQMFVMTAGESQLATGNNAVIAVSNIATLIDPTKGLFIGPIAFNVATNGDVSGTFTVGVDTLSITGKVQGSAIVFNIINPNALGANFPPISITRVVGTIGLNGSVSGNFTDMSGLDSIPPNPAMTKGIFVGSFIPASGVQVSGIQTFVSNFYTPGASTSITAPDGTGLMNIVARDLFVSGNNLPRVQWGQSAMTAVDFAAAPPTVSMTNLPLRFDAGSVAANNGTPNQLTFTAGQYVMAGTNNATPTNIVILEYALPTGEKMFVATAVGSRRGIYMISPIAGATAGKLDQIGESYMTKASGIVPGLSAGTTYDVTVASIHAGMPGQTRVNALGINTQFAQPQSVGPMLIPGQGFNANNGYIDTAAGAPELIVFQGSTMAMKLDTNNNFADNQFAAGTTDDHIRVVEFFESGAMMGEEISGGTLDPDGVGPLPAITMSNFPSTFVGFFHVQNAASPSFTGNLNFLARTIYASDFSTFLDAVVTGSLDITTAPTTTATGSATLTATDAAGTAINATLSIDAIGTKYGMYHIHGQITGTGAPYVDLFWPIGSKKSTYVLSNPDANNANALTVSEVGEAYITQ